MQAIAPNMASGERKWASSTRRGGMTVLGKVAVPKPINLPSQKLENHGMDPNVEIVPKGTLSWGSRSSSPASNAWGSSLQSLTVDNGRPSSGGSGTRPSTGGSEKANDSSTNAWGSNSRPSSASGSLASNQASGTTLRPHSADTRPGSSQLSRFAEPSSENLGAYSKNENFSLASGDFPTLGSEKECPSKNDHSSPQGDNTVADAGINSDIMEHGRIDSPPYEDGRQPNMEKLQGDALQRNPVLSAPPQHFPPWHGAPVGSPQVGVWFRGPPGAPPYAPPGGPPYGPPGAPPYGPSGIPAFGPLIGPGGFPVEHPYYQPPMPVPTLGNSQPGPHHGAGPRGLHHNNGEMYRPHMPDVHFRPGMPMKPGFFPGPGPVPYEGFYPPPMGYLGSNERDIPYMGPAGGPAVYDRHFSSNAPNLVNSQSASGGPVSNEKPARPEQVADPGHRHNHQEQYKVLLKQKGDGHEWGDSTPSIDPQYEKGYHHGPSSHEKDHSAGSNNNVKMHPRRTPGSEGGPVFDSHTQGHGGSPFHGRERLKEERRNSKGIESVEKHLADNVSSSYVVVPPKDTSLIKKIEDLNAKARGTDGKQDFALDTSWDEGKGKPNMISKGPHPIFPDSSASVIAAKNNGGGIIIPPISHVSEAADGPISARRLSNSGPQIRTDYRSKGKSDFLETEGRHKRPYDGHLLTVVSSSKSESVNLGVSDQLSNIGTGKSVSSLEGKDLVPNSGLMPDPIDVERSKKREIAKQRVIQRQKEEEERIKEQKAKAQAKLEELNRRTKLMGNSTGKGDLVTEKAEKPEMGSSSGESNHKLKEAQLEQPISASVALKSVPSSEINSLKPNCVYIGTRTLDPQLQIPKNDLQGNVMSSAVQERGHHNIDARAESQHYGGKNNALKSKSRGYYKEKQNFQLEKVASEKIVKASGDSLKHDNKIGEEFNKNVILPAEHVVPQRTKSNKSGNNKNKVEDKSSSVVIQSVVPKKVNDMNAPMDSGKPQTPKMVEATHTRPPISSSDWALSTEPHASQLEKTQGRISSQSRYQSSGKQSRNQQGNIAVDKSHVTDTVVWAPVRQHNKEVTEGSCTSVVCEEAGDHNGNSDHVQSNIKNKRAEIERYVPKPVAKELAQQGSSQQPALPTAYVTDSSATKVETADDNKIGDDNYNRKGQARAFGACRQRVSSESFHGQGPEDGSLACSVVGKDIHIPAVQNHVEHPDSHATREKKISSDGWNSLDKWETNTYKAPDDSVPASWNQGSFNRGKRHYNKGSRNTETYGHDHGKDMDNERSHLTVSNKVEQDKTVLYKEPHPSRGGGGSQNFGAETSRFVNKEPGPHGDHYQPKDVKATHGVSNRHLAPAKINIGPIGGPQNDKRERKVGVPQVGASQVGAPVQVKQISSVENQQAQPHLSLGLRKNVNQNDRNFRGEDSIRELHSFEQDRRYHKQPSGRGRPRHNNSHYEYKPKGQGHSAG